MTFDTFLGKFNQTSHSGNMPYACALYAQAVLETNNFKSNIFMNHRNAFGMRPSVRREKFYDSVYDSSNGQFASYPDVIRSIQDRLDLDSYNGILPPKQFDQVRRYFDLVQSKNYAPGDSEYVNKIMNIIEQLGDGQYGDTPSVDDDGYEEDQPLFDNKKKIGFAVILVIVAYFVLKKYKIIR